MSEWKLIRVADVSAEKGLTGGPFGSTLGSKDYAPSGIPVIRGNNLASDGRFDSREFAFVTPDKAERDLSRNLAAPGDLVFTQRGTLGQVGIVPESPYDQYVISQSQMRLRVDPKVADTQFVYYQFKSPEMIAAINNLAITTGVPHINLGILGDLELSLPPLPTQKAISAVLGALDDKIALNDRIAATARELAQSYFQAAVQADSHECDLASVTELVTRGVTPRYTEDATHLVVLNQRCVRDGRVSLDPARRTLADNVPAQKLLMPNDVLVNSTGFGTLGRVARWSHEIPCTVDSHITIVRFDEARIDPVCAGFAMLTAQKELESLGEGSTGQTELNRVRLSEFRITVPEEEKAKELRPTLQALETRGNAALAESVTLAKLRDTLLPGLMSGAIRVRDAERAVEEAT
jgi:type I restriction enzyme S subunit